MAMLYKRKMFNNLSDSLEVGNYKVEFNRGEDRDIKVIFMGTPSFAVPILEALIDKYNVIMVVCQPDRKKDRRGNIEIPETKRVALEYGIEVFQPERLKVEYQKVLEASPDIIITCAYGQIVPDIILECPRYGCINVHGSLLPELRGGAPIHWAIIRGYKETGITIMDMSSKMDAGDIIAQEKIAIGNDMILDDLYQKMSILGRDLLLKTLPDIINGTCVRKSQNDDDATFAYNVKKEETKINFSDNAYDIHNLVRGLNSSPGAFCYLDDKRLKIYEVELMEESVNKGVDYGEIIRIEKDGIIVNTKDKLIKIKDIALEGKKRCKVREFLNGVKKEELVGKVLK